MTAAPYPFRRQSADVTTFSMTAYGRAPRVKFGTITAVVVETSAPEALSLATLGGFLHALDERHRFRQRNRPSPRAVEVAADRPRALVVMRVRRQNAISKVDAPPIEQLAVGRERDEHRRVTVLDDADVGASLHSPSHRVPFGRHRPA
jgi:hypothetical protein